MLSRLPSPLLFAPTLAALSAVVACGGSQDMPVRDGLLPLEAKNLAPWFQAGDGEPCPEAIAYATGSNGDYDWAHARACIHADVARVWEALREAAVVFDRGADSWSAKPDVRPEYAYSFRLYYTAGTGVVSVTYDVDWWEDVIDGDLEAPQGFAARYQKTAGTVFISMMEGSLIGRQAGPGITALEMIAHLKAMQSDADSARSGQQDIFNGVLDFVHR